MHIRIIGIESTLTLELAMITLKTLSHKGMTFMLRQTHNFKLILIRRVLHSIAMQLSSQYNSIYVTALGASPVQLGSLQSVGNAMGAVASLPAGWLIDAYSLKKIFLVGTVLMGASAALYFIAPHWTYLYAAIILYYVGSRVICTSCTVTCAGELANQERATGRGVCRTLSSIVALATPIIAAWIVSVSGGINATGLRPIYAIQAAIFGLTFVLLVAWLRDPVVENTSLKHRPSLSDFAEVFQQGPDVVRLVFTMALMELPWSISSPFMPLFAHQVKGANEFVLGSIAVAMSIAPLLASIPLGQLADRHGRKKLLFAIAPAAYAANMCLIFSTGNSMLLLAGFLFGFNSISMAIAAAMAAEIMPQQQMGRWIGIVSLVRGLLGIPAPLIGGLIWDHLGPHYVFLVTIAVDLLVRLPLLASIRETLHLTVEPDGPS
jgi:MFS family permease